ncbi:hypothetical protein PG984_000076 [Apiospora sp. TS-2023a]
MSDLSDDEWQSESTDPAVQLGEGFADRSQTEEDDWRLFHVVPRCHYCGFTIAEGDIAVVGGEEPTGRGEVTAPFPWESGRSWYEISLDARFDARHGREGFYDPQHDYDVRAGAAHEACFRHVDGVEGAVRSLEGMSTTLRGALEYSYDPSPSHDQRRFVRMQSRVAELVQAQFPHLLPEICLMVAAYLVPEYAISLFASAWLNARTPQKPGPGPGWCTVSCRGDIWGAYVAIDGILYLSDLSNTPSPTHPIQLHKATTDPELTITSWEDHQGVRELISSSMPLDALVKLSVCPKDFPAWVHQHVNYGRDGEPDTIYFSYDLPSNKDFFKTLNLRTRLTSHVRTKGLKLRWMGEPDDEDVLSDPNTISTPLTNADEKVVRGLKSMAVDLGIDPPTRPGLPSIA